MAREFKTYSPSESRYSARIKDEEWERHREKLTRLHHENVPRKQILDMLKREDGFSPSLAQLNARFHLWGLRRYEKSTPINSENSPLASQDRRPDPGQPGQLGPSFSPSATAVTPLVHPQPQLFQFELEGVGGGFEAVDDEDIEDVVVVADNSDPPWVDLGDPGSSYGGLEPVSSQLHDQMIGTSGYPDNGHAIARRFGYEDASSSGSRPVMLTPATGTPSQVSSYSNTPSNQLELAQRLESAFQDSHSSGMGHDAGAAGAYRRLPRSTRPTAPPPYVIPRMQLPTDLQVTDSLLRCVSEFASLMVSGRQKRSSPPPFLSLQSPASLQLRNDIQRQQIRRCVNVTAEAYENAHYFLKLGEPTKAIQRLHDASPTVAPMLDEPDLFLLTRLVEIATWSSWKKFPEYEPVVFKYLSREAGKRLGPQHPLTLLLGCFSQAAAVSTSYPALWTCIIHHIDRIADDADAASRGEAQQIRIKAYFYLVRVLRNNARYDEAVRRCEELIQLCITVDGVRSFSANRARYNLAVNHCEAGDLPAAKAAYRDAREYLGTTDRPCDGWVFAVFASSELAQLLEQEGEMDKAGEFYEEALLNFLRFGGDESSGALLMLKDFIEFHERLHNHEQLDRIKRQYPACCTSLEIGGLDNAQHWVGHRVTIQASGGKRWRAWTWTSPIT